MEIRIDPRRTTAALLAAAVILALLHVAGMYARYVLGRARLLGVIDTFNMNFENNVPTFFSALLLVACAVSLAVVARLPSNTQSERRHWGWLAVVFAFLALDEDAAIHELWIGPIQHFFPMSGAFYFAWVIPYGIALLVLGLIYLRFVLSLPDPTRFLTIVAGTLYLGGALVFEMIGGWYLSEVSGDLDFAYAMIVGCEEFLEMCGAILFLYTVLNYLERRLAGEPVAVRVRSG